MIVVIVIVIVIVCVLIRANHILIYFDLLVPEMCALIEGAFAATGHTRFVDWASAASFAFSVRIHFQGPLSGSTGARTSCGMALDGM